MAINKNIDINELNALNDLLSGVKGTSLYESLSTKKANEELQEFLKTNSECKTALEELAKAQEEYNKATTKAERIKAEEKYNRILTDRNKELEKAKSIIDDINKRRKERGDIDDKIEEMQKGINVELEKERRSVNKQYELFKLQKKELTEGLTLNEKISSKATEIGEKWGMNTDKIKTGFGELSAAWGKLKSGISDVKDGVNKFNEAWGKVDQAAADFTKRIGGSAASMENLRKSTIDFMETRGIGIKYNTSMEELIKLQGDYNASIGRSIDLTNDQKETFAAMKSVVGDQMAMDFSLKLENFGLNPDEVGDRVGQMFSKAAKSGIAFEKYSKNFLDNIKLAQNYNFQNGLRGLESMAKKATAIKLDMQQVARFADKVSTLEGAVQAGAQLSVLGGSFAQMGNPLSMLYEGLNDMEGLQDRMVKMFGNMGKWDYSKGQVDVSVFNKQRIKAAAEATGMDYSAVMEMINAQARRNIVEGKLGSQYNNDKDFKELLLNKAQLDENGNAYVTINGEKKDVNKLTSSDEEYLKTANNSDSDNIAEIAVNTRGFKDITEGFEDQKDVGSAQVNEMTGVGKATKEILAKMGENPMIMRTLGVMEPALTAIKGMMQTIVALLMAGHAMSTIGGGMFGGGGGAGCAGGVGGVGSVGGAGFGIGGRFGKRWAITDSVNGAYTNGLGQTLVRGDRGYRTGRIMNGVGKYGTGVGMAAGLVGGAIDAGTSMYYADKQKDGGYIAGKTIGKGLEMAGTGAMIGSMFGPVGTLIGAGVGLVGGALYGGLSARAEAKKENAANYLRSTFGATINNADAYSLDELERMRFGSRDLSNELKQKMVSNGDDLGGYKDGGLTPSGPSGAYAGDVHANEAVLNEKITKDARDPNKDVIVKPQGNTLNVVEVNKNIQDENRIPDNIRMEASPIKIDLTGNLAVNGQKVDPQEVLNTIGPVLTDKIDKELKFRNNYRIDRYKDTHKKFNY